ncbi:MAG: membrane protein [Chitinophagales bacterium]|nr:MAG: membrane protein [Chitinophagales bacterium]
MVVLNAALTACLGIFLSAAATVPQLSPLAEVSLLTCAPGKALYEAFGHNALRIKDPDLGIDRTYNYGTFDFDQPNFYVNFAMGRQNYMLATAPARYFIYSYVIDNRTVYEDVLNLSADEKQRIFELLEENAKPENRYYRYDYLYDNCATRLRDILIKVLGEQLYLDTSYAIRPLTFRQLMDLYIDPFEITEPRIPHPWGDLGIDLALGSEIDVPATAYQYMFLPDFVRLSFGKGRISRGDSIVPLVNRSSILYKAVPEAQEREFFSPLNVFSALFFFFLILTIWERRSNRHVIAIDGVYFALIGFLGLNIAFISFFTDHHAARNYNLLWAFPIHCIFPVLCLMPCAKKILANYYLFTALLSFIVLTGCFTFLPQQIHYATYPLMLVCILRGINGFLYVKKSTMRMYSMT